LLIEVGAKGWPSAGSSRGRQSGCEGVPLGRTDQNSRRQRPLTRDRPVEGATIRVTRHGRINDFRAGMSQLHLTNRRLAAPGWG